MMPNFSGECQVIESPDPILAVESDDEVLPCHVEPPDDMVAFVLEWSKLMQHSDLNGRQRWTLSMSTGTPMSSWTWGHVSQDQKCDGGRWRQVQVLYPNTGQTESVYICQSRR